MSNVFGRAKYGGNKRNWFKLGDGDKIFRILPPMGDLAKDGVWHKYYAVHYGYKNSKNETRTFQSPLVVNGKTKMIEIPDAALDRINQLTAKLEQARKDKNEELVQQLLKFVGGQKSRYNLDKNQYMNVIDLQGNIGILKIRYKAKLALDAVIKKLRDSGIEPLDPENGRFFVFTRSGTNRDTTYQVSVYKKKITVTGIGEVEQDVVHTITDEIANRCLVVNKDGSYTYKEAANLATLFKKPTAAEVERMVKEGEKAVDEILDAKSNSTVDVGEDGSDSEDDEPVQSVPVETKAELAPAAPVAAVSLTEVLAAAPTKVEVKEVTPVKTETKVPTAPKTTAQVVADQSVDEFLKSLEQ